MVNLIWAVPARQMPSLSPIPIILVAKLGIGRWDGNPAKLGQLEQGKWYVRLALKSIVLSDRVIVDVCTQEISSTEIYFLETPFLENH